MPYAAFTTLHDAQLARDLARTVVKERLAACVQIGQVTSVFRWDGAVQEEPEFRLLFKTSAEALPNLKARALSDHPYDEPAFWAVEMDTGSDSFFDWIHTETKG
ncbi:hypothetical protein ACMU_03565 [Actibacterium mucosum KCTC 23349]|uniref:Divalent cation transporter n=1 Tax=Actibacterium mucosum KCTC 23349 TaxID=1454373 RepID=A0A037ZEY3_9RHOB|nr:divalent-cation tolerance protein CutA [Actibacterium mucosum]KAJ54173.1 hypothetical protein ACMU_03565 [Actibacterium mucosum KCTC 23349]